MSAYRPSSLRVTRRNPAVGVPVNTGDPSALMLARSVVPVLTVRTYTSSTPFVSAGSNDTSV